MSDLTATFQGLVEVGFGATLMAAVAAVPVVLLVLAIDRSVGKWIAAHVRCWLWIVVVVRLLMPIGPGSPVSAQYVWRLLEGKGETAAGATAVTATAISTAHVRPAAAVADTDAAPPVPTWDWETIVIDCMLAVWLTGVAVVLLRAVVASWRFGRQLREIPPDQDEASIDIVRRACDQLGVQQDPQVKYVPGLPTPALFGLFRPTLCLPKETQTTLSTPYAVHSQPRAHMA